MRASHTRITPTLATLAILVALLGAAAAAAGLFWPDAGSPRPFTTVHGETVELYGRGLYRADSALSAPIQRGTGAVILFVAVPLLVGVIWLARRGSLRAQVALPGVLVCFLYNAVSLAFGVMFNPLFPLYVAYVSVAFFAFVLAFSSIDLDRLPALISPRLPRRGIAIFTFIVGLLPMVWLIEIVAALVEGGVPGMLGPYTTDVTTILDVGLITPSTILAGILLLRRKPFGYLLTSTILILLTLVGLIVVGQTAMQVLDGYDLTAMEIALYVLPFVSLAAVALFVERTLLKNLAPHTGRE